jgi:hypothetical protein
MITLKGRAVMGGRASGPALVSRMPMNFTAAVSNIQNAIPGRRGVINDRLHELYGRNMKGTVMIFPACIGSTFTGMVLLELMRSGYAPAAIVVQDADPLLVSGVTLAEVWFAAGIPVVEYQGDDLFDRVRMGDLVEVDGGTGEIILLDRETA